MAKLTSKARKAIPTRDFAGPDRSYPIEDMSHAKNALSRVSQFGTAELKAHVRAKVHRKYPDLAEHKRTGGAVAVEGKRSKHRLDRPHRADGGSVDTDPVTRRRGQIKLREEMGGEPALFGPLNRALYGIPLKGKPASDVEATKSRQMKESEDISDAVPRRRGGRS